MDKDKALLRILERLPVPAVIASPVTAKILWVNGPLLRMYGVDDPARVVGTSLLDFIDASQATKALADLARVVMGQSPPPVTYKLRRVTGEYAAGQVSSVPMKFQDHVAMLSFVTDVSERERLLLDLQESEERYRLLLDSMPSGVVVVVDDDIAYVNRALVRALGFESPRELLGQPMYRFVAEPFRKPVRDARQVILKTGRMHPAAPVVLLRADGSPLKTTAASTVIHWEGGLATQTLMHDLGTNPAR